MTSILDHMANTGGDTVLKYACVKAHLKAGNAIKVWVSYGNKKVFLDGTVRKVTRKWLRDPQRVNDTWYNDEYEIDVPGCPIYLDAYAEEDGYPPRMTIPAAWRNDDLDAWIREVGLFPDQQPQEQGTPSEDTYYRHFLRAVEAAANPDADIATLDLARNALASRAGMLTGRQMRGYQQVRKQEIESLQQQYRAVVARMLAMGWR